MTEGFTLEKYREATVQLDQFMTKLRTEIPDEWQNDKYVLFQKLREAAQWMRDIFELDELRRNPHKFDIRAVKPGETNGSGKLITTDSN